MDKISITKVAYVIYVAVFGAGLNRVGIASVIGIFIQGFRSFASTFLRSPLGQERFQIKKTNMRPEKTLSRSRRCTDYFIVIINFRSDDLNFC